MNADKNKVLDLIKKLLALAKSSNEHEAANALRRARGLMALHGIHERDMLAAGCGEACAKAGAKVTPAQWEATLAGTVADAFGCRMFFREGISSGKWVFIGIGMTAELAQYCFLVMLRQVKSARADYMQAKLKRCKTATKTRRADLFCEGWVNAVRRQVRAFAGSEEETAAIAAYLSSRYPALVKLDCRQRNDAKLGARGFDDLMSGALSGREARIHHGVAGQSGPLALEHA